MEFRKATEDDVSALYELHQMMNREELAMGCSFSHPIKKSALKRLITNPLNPSIVCIVRGRIKAFAYAERQGEDLLLHNVFVLPEYRKCGIATKMFHKITGKRGGKIYAYVLNKNDSALRFWQNKGFTTEKFLPNAVKISRLI